MVINVKENNIIMTIEDSAKFPVGYKIGIINSF